MHEKSKNIIIIILAVALLVCLATLGIVLANRQNAIKELTGTVVVAGEKYLIISSDGEDYLLNGIKDSYEIGDEIKVSFKEKNLDTKSEIKAVEIEEEKLINSASTDETATNDETSPSDEADNREETPNNPAQDSPNANIKPIIPGENASTPSSKNTDDEVLSYVTELESDFKSGSVKDSLKSGFITVVDFIFYDGTIKGHTFKDLSDSAKLKVLSAALYFDSKIDTYFPGYKESISMTTGKIYTTLKKEITESYLNVATLICSSNQELCTTAKKGFGELKKNFGLSWALIKDIAGDGVSKLKSWYEIFRDGK